MRFFSSLLLSALLLLLFVFPFSSSIFFFFFFPFLLLCMCILLRVFNASVSLIFSRIFCNLQVCLYASLEIFHEASMPALRAKSLMLTGFLEALLTATVPSSSVRVISPTHPDQRGCQLSLLFPQPVRPINQQLLQRGVIADVREPNVLRVSPVPLYNSFRDVYNFVLTLQSVLASEL